MDIAGFVGFAASGPLHRPVVVEDAARFADIFGEDLELVPGGSGREPVFAHLAPSVRAFFANGGRRCWVVRVAEPDIEPQVFPVPGLVAIGRSGAMRPALARARSPGSWADRLTLETTLRPRRIPGAGLADEGGERLLSWPLRHGEPPVPGDLLRLRFTSEGRERLAFLPVVQAPAREGPAFTLPFRAGEAVWLREPAALELPAQVTVPLADGSAREVAASAGAGGAGAFRLEGVAPAAVQPGLALPVRLAGEDGAGGMVLVARTAPERDPASGALVALNVVPDALWVLEEEPPADPGALLDVVRLRFDLVARELETRHWRIAGLALVPDDARFWATLPDDLTLFPPPDAPEPERAREAPGALALEASRPRFPFAGRPDAGEVRLFLPLGMSATPDAGPRGTALGEVDPASRLERDGLGTFAAALFLDPDLAGIGQTFHDLPGRALDKRYLRRDPQPLRGLHALYFLDEVTLLAVPDAVHGGWEAERHAPEVRPPLVAPVLEPIDRAGSPPRARWSHPGPDPIGYELEQATDPVFEPVQRRYLTETREVALDVRECPQDLRFRVRALGEREPSPWSNTVHARLPAAEFDDCARPDPLAAPTMSLPQDAGSGARFPIAWTRIEGASRYRLEQSGGPAFEEALVLALVDQPETGATGFEVLHGVTERTFWRVRAETVGEDGELVEVGPWSATALALPPAVPQVRLVRSEPEEADPIALEVHLAMLRMAAARADMLAVLSFGGGTGLARALAHRQALGQELGFDEEAALAFGALYLPWLRQRERGGASRFVPPDGAIVGRAAERALLRGAWVAPANQPLADVIALEGAFGRADWATLYEQQVNLLQAAPEGFMALSADTLSSDPRRRPINVRRLIALLRRLCLREGNRLVFEPNGPSLRRRTRLLFESIMADLFARGAFAGRRPDEGYRVRVGDEPGEVDAGRLIVELRIAPSHPLEFLTVRLIENRESGSLRIEEAA